MRILNNKDYNKIIKSSNVETCDCSLDNQVSYLLSNIMIKNEHNTCYGAIRDEIENNMEEDIYEVMEWLKNVDAADCYMERVIKDGYIDTGIYYTFNNHIHSAYREWYIESIYNLFGGKEDELSHIIYLYCLDEYMMDEGDIDLKTFKKIIEYIDSGRYRGNIYSTVLSDFYEEIKELIEEN